MTFRAIFFGLLAAVLIACGGYLCAVLHIPPPTRGHFPVAVFGFLFLGLVSVNPLLGVLRARWRFTAGELSVVLGMALVACSLPSAGLMNHWPSAIVMPRIYAQTEPGWKKGNLIHYIPREMILSARYGEPAIAQWQEDKGVMGREPLMAPDKLPWGAWRTPIVTWTLIILLTAAAVIGLSLVVHRQWAARERLRYPIAEFTTTVLYQRAGPDNTHLLRSYWFWIPFVIFWLIRLTQGWNIINPNIVTIPLKLDLSGLAEKFPEFAKLPAAATITNPQIIPAAAAFVFFLGSDIGLSLGISSLVTVGVFSVLLAFGIQLTGTPMAGGAMQWQAFGAFLGYALLVVYLGRRHYAMSLRGALLGTRDPETPPHSIWGFRLLLVASGALIVVLTHLGLAWPLSILFVGAMLMMFLVLARINAECGVFFYEPLWAVPGVMLGLFGIKAIGLQGLSIILLGSVMLMANPFEALIPYVVNALKISDRSGIKAGRSGATMGIAYVVALVVLIPLVIWCNYNFGAGGDNTGGVKTAFDGAERAVTLLGPTGELSASEGFSPVQRILNADVDPAFLIAVAVGLGGVLLMGQLRMRLPWWPLHPILLLGFGSGHIAPMSFSFLLGWGIKEAVSRLGGGRAYQQTKVAMIGVIAGELVGGLSWIIINWILIGITGFSWAYLILW